jgi:hypothetical protein
MQGVPEESKKQPYYKPISRAFQAQWNEAERIEPERGVKRPFGKQASWAVKRTTFVPLPGGGGGGGFGLYAC